MNADAVADARPRELTRGLSRAQASVSKRLFDLVFAATALAILAPLLVLLALAIFCEDGGPVLFRQRRTGLNGAVFKIYKFRSMRAADDGPEVRQAVKADDRVTRVGRVLRHTSLDELPQ